MTASYVLMDSWFTFAPLIRAITQRGLDVIGMVKPTNHLKDNLTLNRFSVIFYCAYYLVED